MRVSLISASVVSHCNVVEEGGKGRGWGGGRGGGGEKSSRLHRKSKFRTGKLYAHEGILTNIIKPPNSERVTQLNFQLPGQR